MGARLVGVPQMASRLGRLAERWPKKVGGALFIETELMVTTPAKKSVPVDTGALKSTIHTEGPDYKGTRITTATVAGGPAADYAERVHEDLKAHHDNGEAKYIEKHIRAAQPTILYRVGMRVGLAEMVL